VVPGQRRDRTGAAVELPDGAPVLARAAEPRGGALGAAVRRGFLGELVAVVVSVVAPVLLVLDEAEPHACLPHRAHRSCSLLGPPLLSQVRGLIVAPTPYTDVFLIQPTAGGGEKTPCRRWRGRPDIDFPYLTPSAHVRRARFSPV